MMERRGQTSAWERRNGKIEKPAARLGCVGGKERVGLGHERVCGTKVTVCAYCVNLCVFSLPGQVCSYLIPTTTVSESCGAGLIVSVDVCVFMCTGICVYLE